MKGAPEIDRLAFLQAAALGAPVAIFVAIYTIHAPNVPLINPDSDGYRNFAAIRTGRYPLFLAFIEADHSRPVRLRHRTASDLCIKKSPWKSCRIKIRNGIEPPDRRRPRLG